MNNDLSRPLGQDRRRAESRPARTLGARGAALVMTGVLAAAMTTLSFASRDSFGVAEITLDPPLVAGAAPVVEPGMVAAATPDGAESESAPAYQPATPDASVIQVTPDGSGQPEGTSRVIVIRDPAAIGRDTKLAHVPVMAALEDSSFGKLPVRTGDGKRPMDLYARPWSDQGGPRVAILLGGVGLSQSGTQDALAQLPPEVTLGLAPHGNSLGRWMVEARKKGFELMVQAPMEPYDYPRVDPGPSTLKLAASTEANLESLQWTLGRTTNYAGVANYLGGRFLTDPDAMAPVMAELAFRGLMYFDDGTAQASVANKLAAEKGVAYARGDLVIDGASQNPADITRQLDELERIARTRGYALGSGTVLPATVSVVSDWVNAAKKRGVQIVPVTSLARDPERKKG